MSNVLPPPHLRAEKRRFYARCVFVGAVVVSIIACIAIISLVPAFASVRIARAALERRADPAANISEEQAAAFRSQKLIALAKPLANATSSPTELLTQALAGRPADVVVTNISYRSGERSIVLSGVSPRRASMETYRSALENSDAFTSVSVPVAALLGTQEGRFTITLKY